MKHGFWIRDCTECGHRFAAVLPSRNHVNNIYADGYFKGGGAGYPDYLAGEKILISRGKKYARLLAKYTKPGRVLDVGSAAGFILKGLEEEGWKGAGIEPNPAMAEYARRHLGVMVETGTLEDLRSDSHYDLVCMIQVIAHFVDPCRALQAAARMTKPGGYWLIEAWNMQSWTARASGKSWHEYNPPSALHWFSQDTLREIVGKFGLREIARGRTIKWIRPAHVSSIGRNELNGSATGRLISAVAGLFPERIALPYIADDLFFALYQRQEAGLLRCGRGGADR